MKNLPDRFFIKREPYNAHVINDWFTQKTGVKRKSLFAYLYYPSFHGACHSGALSLGYVEITFEQFQQALNLTPKVNNSYSIF